MAEKSYGFVSNSLLKMEMREKGNKAGFICPKQPQSIIVFGFLREGQKLHVVINWGCWCLFALQLISLNISVPPWSTMYNRGQWPYRQCMSFCNHCPSEFEKPFATYSNYAYWETIHTWEIRESKISSKTWNTHSATHEESYGFTKYHSYFFVRQFACFLSCQRGPSLFWYKVNFHLKVEEVLSKHVRICGLIFTKSDNLFLSP